MTRLHIAALILVAASASTAFAQSDPLPDFDLIVAQHVARLSTEDPADRQRAQLGFEGICLSAARPGGEAERRGLCEAMLLHLGPETPHEARYWLIRMLERIGHDESVDALAKLFADPDERVRELARRALEANPSPAAAEHLRNYQSITSATPLRVALINSLGSHRDATSVAQLADTAAANEPQVARAAIAALGEIADPAAQSALMTLLADSPYRESVAAALLRVADKRLTEGNKDEAAKIAKQVLQASTSELSRVGALNALAASNGIAALPLLEATLDDVAAEFRNRAAALRFIAELPGSQPTTALTRRLPELPPELQVVAIHSLAERRDTAARGPVIAALEASDDERVRLAGLWSLRHLGDDQAVGTLSAIAADSDGEEQRVARESLARLEHTNLDDALITGMRELAPQQRVECIRALETRRCFAATPALLKIARDGPEDVRVAALEALSSLGGDATISELLQMLMQKLPREIRSAAEESLSRLCGTSEQPSVAMQTLLATWEPAGDVSRISLIRVIGRLGDDAGLPLIRTGLNAGDQAVSDAAVRALADWPTSTVLDELSVLARDAESQTHKILALRGMIRLIESATDRDAQAKIALYREALSLTDRPEEIRLALAGLGRLREEAAIRLIENYLDDEAVGNEAGAAFLQAVRAFAVIDTPAARSAFDTTAPHLGEQLQPTIDETRAFFTALQGNITQWEYAGPYTVEGEKWSKVYDMTFAPDKPTEHPTAGWRPLKPTNLDEPWSFDLTSIDTGSDRCIYARTSIWSVDERPAKLLIGSDDAVRVLLNGEAVYESKGIRGHSPLGDEVPITLTAGRNYLLLKVVQASGGWAFSCGVRDEDGAIIDGLIFEPPQ